MQIFALCLAVLLIHGAKGVVFKDKTGDIRSLPAASRRVVHHVLGEKGEKVVFEISDLKLHGKSTLKLRDVKSGLMHKYTRSGSKFKVTVFENKRKQTPKIVTLPITMTTKSNKLSIYLNLAKSRLRQGFIAHYMIMREPGFCRKAIIPGLNDDVTILDCDTEPSIVTASQCTVSNDCGVDYEQKSNVAICNQKTKLWEGDVICKPRSDVMERCRINYDDFTIRGCPFEPMEMVHYYVEKDNYVTNSNAISIRTSRRAINCSELCGRDKQGRRRRCRKNERVPCFVCRFINRCNATWAFF